MEEFPLSKQAEWPQSSLFEEIGVASGPPRTNTHLDSSRVPYSMNDGGLYYTNELFQSSDFESATGPESLPLDPGAASSFPYAISILPSSDAYHAPPLPLVSLNEQFPITSSKLFPQMKETTQYPRSLASNATTDHTTGSILHESIGALSAQSAEDNQPIEGFQPTIDTPSDPSPSWWTPKILYPDTSATMARVKPSRHRLRATEGKGRKKQEGKKGKSQRAKEKIKIIAWEFEDGHSKGKFRNKFAQ